MLRSAVQITLLRRPGSRGSWAAEAAVLRVSVQSIQVEDGGKRILNTRFG